MVALKGNSITSVPLSEVGGKLRIVPLDHKLIEKARRMDVCFGDDKS
jgi:6-phosphofructokinase 1